MMTNTIRIIAFSFTILAFARHGHGQELVTLRNSFGKKITVWFMPNCVGKWKVPGLNLLDQQSRKVEFLHVGKHCLQILDRDGARLFIKGVDFSKHVYKYGNRPIDLKVRYRQETRTENVQVSRTRMETRTRQVPVTRTRTETRTRTVSVYDPSTGTYQMQPQTYQVNVPETSMVTQNYQVNVPYTETVTQSSIVNVPTAVLEIEVDGTRIDITDELKN